ncbi:unnamed protein product [Orchesella dallaii]|uniref:Uncharacterized protein n=1 Tax=Orchesella dallaii TaxID=48710 RepID=A0ABP1RC46_9HEXA
MTRIISPFVALAILCLTLSFTESQNNYDGGDYSIENGNYYEEPIQGPYPKFQFYPGADIRALPVAQSEPEVRPLQLDLAKNFRKGIVGAKKQAEEAGGEMTDMMQKPITDMSKAMEGRMKTNSSDPAKEKSSEEKEEDDSDSKEETTTKKPSEDPSKPETNSKEVVPEPKRIQYPNPDFVDVQPRPRYYFDFYE